MNRSKKAQEAKKKMDWNKKQAEYLIEVIQYLDKKYRSLDIDKFSEDQKEELRDTYKYKKLEVREAWKDFIKAIKEVIKDIFK